MAKFNMPIGNISGTDIKVGDNRVVNKYITINPAQVFKKVEQAIPVEERESVLKESIEPLEELAALPPEEQKTPEVQEQASSIYERLGPHLPLIGKVLLQGSLAGLTALANTNPIIAGLIAACQALKDATENGQ